VLPEYPKRSLKGKTRFPPHPDPIRHRATNPLTLRHAGVLGDVDLGVGGDRSAIDAADGRPFRLADLAGAPWILDPADTGPGQWARNACREAGFEPDVRYAGSDLLFEILLAERGHAVSVIPKLLLSAVPRPDARIQRIPGRPHRRLTTGVRAGAAGQPAIRAFREALRHAVREAGQRETTDEPWESQRSV
jgi:hypothetical protein